MNSTLAGNETMTANSTKDVVASNETGFNIIETVANNETIITYEDIDIPVNENGTFAEGVNDAGNETIATNSTSSSEGDTTAAAPLPTDGGNDTTVSTLTPIPAVCEQACGIDEVCARESTDANSSARCYTKCSEFPINGDACMDKCVHSTFNCGRYAGVFNDFCECNAGSYECRPSECGSDFNDVVASNETGFNINGTVMNNVTIVTYDDIEIPVNENGTFSETGGISTESLCPASLTRSMEIDDFATLFYAVVPSTSFESRNGIFCARLQVNSIGWVGFAVSRDGSMVGSEAIIGHPDDNTVFKYSLFGKFPDAIIKVDDEHQTLRETSITQDAEIGVTTMKFTKYLDEFDEIPILVNGTNYFLYARGGSNVFGYHSGRMYFKKDFAGDADVYAEDFYEDDVDDTTETSIDDNSNITLNANQTYSGDQGSVSSVDGNLTDTTVSDANLTDKTDTNIDLNFTLVDVNETTDVITASTNTADTEDMNATDSADLTTTILDVLSSPYTMTHELQGISGSARYGFSVAMSSDGNIIAVGAKDMTGVALGEVGAVRLYSLETSTPTLIQTLVNEYPNGEFGNSIGLSNDGNRLVVGARSENDQAGVVRVYERDSFGQWVLLGMPISGASSGDRVGWSVSISGDGSSVAIGAPKGGGSASGAVVTYRFEDGSNWASYGSALEGVSGEAFGYATSLSYDGNFVAVGTPKATNPEGASNAGKASVFHLYGTEWLPLPGPGKDVHGISANDIDGTSIALSQDGAILVVGGKGGDNEDGVSNVGHCRIYEFGTDWELLHSMEGQTENERLGSSVAVSGDSNVVACGGETAMYDGVGTGVVRVWNRKTSEASAVWPRNSEGGDLFGSTLSLKEDGKMLAVGAPERDSMTAGNKAGAVDIYEDFMN